MWTAVTEDSMHLQYSEMMNIHLPKSGMIATISLTLTIATERSSSKAILFVKYFNWFHFSHIMTCIRSHLNYVYNSVLLLEGGI